MLQIVSLKIFGRTIGWYYYLAFIIPGVCGAVIMWVFFPNSKYSPPTVSLAVSPFGALGSNCYKWYANLHLALGLPLEEVAAKFGDAGMYPEQAQTLKLWLRLTYVPLDEVASYMRDIQVTDEELDQVGGFGKEGNGMLEVEKAATAVHAKA